MTTVIKVQAFDPEISGSGIIAEVRTQGRPVDAVDAIKDLFAPDSQPQEEAEVSTEDPEAIDDADDEAA